MRRNGYIVVKLEATTTGTVAFLFTVQLAYGIILSVHSRISCERATCKKQKGLMDDISIITLLLRRLCINTAYDYRMRLPHKLAAIISLIDRPSIICTNGTGSVAQALFR